MPQAMGGPKPSFHNILNLIGQETTDGSGGFVEHASAGLGASGVPQSFEESFR